MIDEMKLKKVISNVLGVPINEINDSSNSDSLDNWDSLSHINLVLAIEAEFNVALTPEDYMDMLSVKSITMILEERAG
tara:strand:+ start:190 stop:423 length:234 start_codon:yes stop_codon:yes gene_type:complete